MDCIEPGLTYFADTVIDGPLKPALAIFKAARLFNPRKISEMSVTAKSLDALQVVPFFDTEIIGNLKEELPSYLAKASDLSPDHNPLVFWRTKSPELPHWAAAAQKILFSLHQLHQKGLSPCWRLHSMISNRRVWWTILNFP